MAGGDSDPGAKYSLSTGFVFVFNLVIGVGALALPSGFLSAGIVAGILMLFLVAVFSYIGIVFIIETHASAIAVQTTHLLDTTTNSSFSASSSSASILPKLLPPQNYGFDTSDSQVGTPGEEENEEQLFEINRRLELGLMSKLFLGEIGEKLFYLVLVIYLLGDLAIYAATVPSTIVLVLCNGATCCEGSTWKYNVCLGAFTIIIVPWAFFNFQKTRYLQIGTLFLRNFSLLCMIILSIIRVVDDNKAGTPVTDASVFNTNQLPFLFGTSIYAFMCHHSLPSIVTPIENKRRLFMMFFGDFTLIFLVYVGLCLAAVYAFGCSLNGSLLTYRFIELIPDATSKGLRGLYYFLGLYPVFTLSTNYPLIAITLRNNLMNLIPWGVGNPTWAPKRPFIFSALAALPPIVIAYAIRDVKVLVSYTGSYAGLGIMLVVPALLVFFARRKVRRLFPGVENPYRNKVFSHDVWVYFVLIVSAVALVLITYNFAKPPPSICPGSSSNSTDCSGSNSGSGSGSASNSTADVFMFF